MEIAATVLTPDFDLVPTSLVRRAMKGLSDIAEEVNEVLQGIGTVFAGIAVGNTISEDLRVVRNGRHDTASRTAISFEIDRAGFGGTTISVINLETLLVFSINEMPWFAQMTPGLIGPVGCFADGPFVFGFTCQNCDDGFFLDINCGQRTGGEEHTVWSRR